MDRSVLEASVEEAERYAAGPTPPVTEAVRARRRLRATELAEVRRAVEAGDWYRAGFRSPTDWLASSTHESIGACRVALRLADRIRRMPRVESAFADGVLAESALRLLTDAWDPAIADTFARDEELLLRWATELPHRDFGLVLGTWRMHADPDREERASEERFDRRSLHLSGLLDDMGRLDGLLDPEGFALVREAIRALAAPAADDTRTATQRRADALVGMARLTLDSLDPEPGRKRNRPKVIATIALDDLVAGSRGGSLDTHLDRTVVPADTVRRLACDCGLHRYVTDPLGTVVDFGRRQRTVTDSQFDQLVVRDHGCRWPGCRHPAAGCDAHHADHWLDGGETEGDNLVLLCWFHHHLLHEQHWSMEPLGAGHFALLDPAGRSHPMRPPLVGLAVPLFGPLHRSATLPG